MLTQVDVVYENESGPQALALPILGLTPKASLILRSITGLNPPDIDLFIGDYSRDGGIYQGRSVQKRNPVMLIDLNPNPALGETVDGLRDILYKTFIDPLVDADYIQLIFHDDVKEDRYLVGYTEKLETDIFSAETLVQVSMVCPDPFIRRLTETVLTHDDGWTTVPFEYRGTAETGFRVQINVVSDTPVVTLKNNAKTMVITHDFLADDIVYINTNRGSRDITYTRAGVTYPLIAKLSPLSRWLEIHSQNNSMKTYGTLPTDLVTVIKSLTYTEAFWGA